MVSVAALLAGAVLSSAEAQMKNGFLLSPTSVPVEEILSGGPPRDGIPALVEPRKLSAHEATLGPADWVVGVAVGDEATAYPTAILEWHELVNDSVGGLPVLVSYCPLCGTAMVFDRRIDGRPRKFGVSGLLYRSDLLLYDRETESLWSQIRSQAVTGPALGQRLALVRSRVLRWSDWLVLHPASKVLSFDTGQRRPYGRSPYGDYATSDRLLFPAPKDARHPPKTPTVGLRLADGAARAYPSVEVVRAGGSVEECFAGRRVRVTYDEKRETFSVDAPNDVEIVEGYWFAWMAFHPESSVFADDARSGRRATGETGSAELRASGSAPADEDPCRDGTPGAASSP